MTTSVSNETTPLLTISGKNEFVDQSLPRTYKKQNRYFHIFVTIALILLLIFAGAVTYYFFSSHDGTMCENCIASEEHPVHTKNSSSSTFLQDLTNYAKNKLQKEISSNTKNISSESEDNYWDKYSKEYSSETSKPDLPEWAEEWVEKHLSFSGNNSEALENLMHEMEEHRSDSLDTQGVTDEITSEVVINNVSNEVCNLTLQSMEVEIILKNNENLKGPREIKVDTLHKKLLAWSPNASDSLDKGFKILGDDDIKSLGPITLPNVSCFHLNPECRYYTKIYLGDLTSDDNLFEVSENRVADLCSVVAPILLQGHYVNTDTFYWYGGATLFAEKTSALHKEKEKSSKVEKKSITLPKIKGSVSIRDRGLWNGTLPVIFNTSALSWYATDDTIVYPVQWSGYYDVSSFEGVFLLPEKVSEKKIRWHDGSFSIELPDDVPDLFRDLIRKDRVYSTVVYLTSNPSHVDHFDISVFNNLNDWTFVDISQVILTGNFDEDGKFHWSGDASIHMGPLSFDFPSTTYRPFGKYLFNILGGELYAKLNEPESVKKWWSGPLTSKVFLPTIGTYDDRLYAHILGEELVWSFNNFTGTSGNGTFRTDSILNTKLFGNFDFNYTFLMDEIWTTRLEPNVTYHSPILLQYERMTFDFGDDMPQRLSALRAPDQGVFAPITLIGTIQDDKFEWDGKCLVTVVDV